jgi:hypothetical protein
MGGGDKPAIVSEGVLANQRAWRTKSSLGRSADSHTPGGVLRSGLCPLGLNL